MENSFFHRLSSILWGVIVTLIVLLAIYVSVGRMLASSIGAFQADILRELNYRVPFTVDAQTVRGEWQSFTPIIVLSNLRLSVDGSAEPPLQLSEGRIGVDVFNSLRTGSLQMTRVALDGLSLRGELTEQGQLKIRGFDGGGQIEKWVREFLLNVELVSLEDNQLKLTLPGGEVRDLDLNALVTRERSYRRVEANLISTGGTEISVLAEGVGNPFKPKMFSGELYLDIRSTDLGAVEDMLAGGSPSFWADGALDLELWLVWDKGEPSVEARVEARDLLVADDEQRWQVPLDRAALDLRLVKRRNHWTLFASNIAVDKDDVRLQLSRMQLDTWSGALRVRASDVPLEPINAIVTSLEATPAALANVFRVLAPRGELTSVQVSIGDIDNPAADWEVEANFTDLAVDSWKGAPGVTSAHGYLQLVPGGGFVVLDSRQLTLELPTIYREPLNYEEFYGTINIEWDARALNLSSGLVTTQGREGQARVLFGLNFPMVKNDIGLEMDLLVGLGKTHPIHRAKYLPYRLNEPLQKWLSSSIGEGSIEQGAFLWRGTVKRKTAPLHTLQMAFNIADTSVNYHPKWPPVTVLDGVILIDDSDVSVWGEQASLFESRVERLSVETWLNENRQIMLAVDGRVQGPAADGLAILNDSPLSSIVGTAFADWTLAGQLETDLALQMNLTDKSVRPRADVTTRWQDVDLDIIPGNLPVRALNGEFTYSTSRGFSSSNLAASLWGEPLQLNLEQRHRSRRKGYNPGSSVLEVAVATRADMLDVRHWLNLESLAFAQGQTAVDLRVLIAPGQSPLLKVDTALAGVSLDLPAPWNKLKKPEVPLHLEMPLASGGNLLSLDLGEELNLQLDMIGGALRAASLAVAAEPAPLEAGVLRITGQAPLLQAEEWTQFVAQYFTGERQDSGSQDDATAGTVVDDGREKSPPLAIVIDQLHTDKLVLWGQEFQDVTFSLAIEPALWRLEFETDWLRGDALLAQDGAVSRLDIERFDLNHLAQLNLLSGEGEGEQVLELPAIDVTLNDIYQADRYLGNLAFKLRSQGDILSAQAITGEIAGMSLRAERPGKLAWRQGQDSKTEVQASLQFEDLSQTLGYFGYQKIIETRSGEFNLDLRWPGAPQSFSLQDGQGSMQVEIGQGSFPQAPSGATGALRVVSILNLADIVRRLSLTHMFESGIPFDSVDGEVYLHRGTIEVARMHVQGGSSFQFSGVSDVAAQSLDGELIATLPVANNLPWVAALAASLPIAAGVFVVSKVFSKQMNRLSSAVYRIGGSWDEPEVKFDHIFDGSTEKEQATMVMPMVESLLGEEEPPVLDPQAPGQSVSP